MIPSNILGLLIALALYVCVRKLSRIDTRLGHLTKRLDEADAVHDATRPVFSRGQLRRARQQFEDDHRNQLELETELYQSNEWRERPHQTTGLPSSLRERMRTVSEALVESECAWREYVYMVESNVAVANGGESRATVLDSFRALLKETRGTPVARSLAPNAAKVRRVDDLLESWVGRLSGATTEPENVNLPDIAEEVFDFTREEAVRRAALRE